MAIPQSYGTLPAILALASCVLYCTNGELLQWLQLHTKGEGHASPLLNMVFCHLGGLLLIPLLHIFPTGGHPGIGEQPSVPASEMLKSTSLFAVLLMSYNYAWLLSARLVAVGLTNAVFQSSIALVYIASVILFGERFNTGQCAGVVLALAGTAMVASPVVHYGMESGEAANTGGKAVLGVLLALGAAVGITVYQVLFRHIHGHRKRDVRFLATFYVYVGVWHLIAILPMVMLASAVGLEPLELPKGNWAISGTVMSAVIASTVNMLYLCIVMWGSPMLLPCASALSVPMTVAADMALHGVRPSLPEITGHVWIVISVGLIMNAGAEQAKLKLKAGRELKADTWADEL